MINANKTKSIKKTIKSTSIYAKVDINQGNTLTLQNTKNHFDEKDQ